MNNVLRNYTSEWERWAGAAGSFRRRRAAATAETEERQVFAIAPSVWLGRRLTSNSIRAARRSCARVCRESSEAVSSAAWAARSRRQSRQNVPSWERVQASGSATRLPSMRLTLTPQASQIHFDAFPLLFRIKRSCLKVAW